MTAAATRSIDWDSLVAALGEIEIIRDPVQVARLSKDYYSYSPLLRADLDDKVADLVVRPANEAEVMKAAAVCVQHRVPVTIRGAGTGNYGQCVPLRGGVVLDLTKLQAVKWVKPGMARVEAGVKLAALDKQTREMGWEIRMAPSTYRTATIGGFIGGGSGGIGSITYGQLRDRGNLLALRVVTMEDEPQVIELRGDDVYKVAHAWGTNGIITELEIPLGPAYPWTELVATFPDFMTAARFGQALGDADGIVKKLICICAAPISDYFAALRTMIPVGSHCALLMVAEPCLEPFGELLKEFGGTICYQKSAQESGKGVAIGEFTWNHTTLHARSVDPSLTYLQTLFPADKDLKLVEHMYHHFGDEVMMHLEFIRVNGVVLPAALQLVRYTTADRLYEIIHYHEDNGAFIANPHTYIIEDGGRKVMDPAQMQFKAMVDPYGLLNPGKIRAWEQQQ
ncbi:FAD-binding oxidoreductase [Thermocoleostomius sinensis]|uniref:FAD-binding oxidoreductase n=1 Tax=Thermocoleostomius sinensis A174 TaxID=2016057 RepID=A0A9E9C675_9CYAN|nr:FAD-binding oxidoreductase [Thermocoleostomius sinensis]WAL58939.1 FAD-binding oxidoreductase [Thermocoleostomius sinensis A174]